MFLLTSELFFWDFIILLSLVGSFGTAVGCIAWLRLHRSAKSIGGALKNGLVSLVALIGLSLGSVVAYGSFIEPQMLTISAHQVNLDTNKPLTLVVLSDPHVGPLKGEKFMERVVYKVNQLLPDLVLLVGDYVFNDRSNLADLNPLKNLRASGGVYAVLGNHDQGYYRPSFNAKYQPSNISQQMELKLNELSITVLRNQNETVTLGTDKLTLIGIDDLWSGKTRLDLAMPAELTSTPKILLVHNPSIVENPFTEHVNLIVSGHTHGGQIRLPKIGPLTNLPTTLGQEFDNGLFDLSGERQLAITRGLGETNIRARLTTPPEIMVLRTK